MDVAVTIPTLNEEGRIGRCLDAVAAALERVPDPFTVSELVVVDGGSTDGTLAVIDQHRLPVRVVHKEKGLLRARDAGIRAADADIVVALDADATYPRDFFAHLLPPFQNPETVLSYGPVLGGTTIDLNAPFRLGMQYGLQAVGRDWVSGSNRAVRCASYEAVDGYDLEKDCGSLLTVMYEEQYAFPRRIAREGRVVFVEEAFSRQSDRTVRQMLMLEDKDGGMDWSMLTLDDALAAFDA